MTESWLAKLSDEDVSFIKRFVLASGSLKDLAKAYGITYPTVRLRLDRLIEKVKILDSQEIVSEFERTLRVRYAEGKLDMETLKALLVAHQEDLESQPDSKRRRYPCRLFSLFYRYYYCHAHFRRKSWLGQCPFQMRSRVAHSPPVE